MFSLIIYCAGLVGLIVLFSFVAEAFENYRNNSWRSRVTAEDIQELRRLFDAEGASVEFNEKGEKFLVGYMKD